MTSIAEEYGYDQDFIDPIPEYLKCSACHFVLKNPVQIMNCGHRYCELCFERIKQYSKHLKSVLCCPVDRQEIDISQVFKDTGITRTVSDLHVKCPFNVHECVWTGELRNLEEHKKQCNYAKKEATLCAARSSENEVNALLLKDMFERLGKCEEQVVEKEKDLAYIKFSFQEMKEKVNKQDKEIDTLKLKNGEMTRGINLSKEMTKTLQETVDKGLLKCSNNYLMNKNELDQFKMRETQHLKKEEIQHLKAEVEEINRKITLSKSKESLSQQSMGTIKKGLKDAQDDIRIKQNNVDKSLNDVKDQVKGLCSKTDKSLDVVKAEVKHKVNQEAFEEMSNEIKELRAYINHTNGLFSFKKLESFKDTSFVWTIPNFKENIEAKKAIESLKFYCRPKGHLCQLFGFFYADEVDMAPCFRLVKGRNSANVADFEMNIEFQILYNDGTTLSKTHPFTFHDNNDAIIGMNFGIRLKKEDMDKYLINNTCTVVCTLTPPS